MRRGRSLRRVRGASAYAWWRRGAALAAEPPRPRAALVSIPLVAVAAFMLFSRITVGEWFVSGGFFVPDEALRGNLSVVYEKIVEGTTLVAGSRFVRIAQISAVVVIVLAAGPPRAGADAGAARAVRRCGASRWRPTSRATRSVMRYEIPLVVAGGYRDRSRRGSAAELGEAGRAVRVPVRVSAAPALRSAGGRACRGAARSPPTAAAAHA